MAGQLLPLGTRELELGGPYLGTLKEATGLRDDPSALRARLREDGYLLIRGLHSPARVASARRVILERLHANAQLDDQSPLAACRRNGVLSA